MMRRISDENGVSNVVSMVMIAGIIISMMGMVFSTYLPAWGKDVEAQTLYGVMDSFMDMKSSVDQLSVRGDAGTSMTTKITLGSGGGPVLGFGRCTGNLQLLQDSGSVLAYDSDGNIYGRARGSLTYSSFNTYVDDQTISMEGGMLIREQAGSSVMKGPPNMVLNDDLNTGRRVLYLLLSTIEGDVRSYSGSETYMIRMTLLSEVMATYDITSASFVIEVVTEHGSLWEAHFRAMALDESIPAGDLSFTSFVDADGNNAIRITVSGIDQLILRNAIFKLDVN
ncbi:MAG: hypothetical protein QCI82_03235 [Candidatus Thermoplasmatota archaeon]|nr:hypothetical protein [Candidatus Thermoplasmatota archaeon]